MLAKMLDGCSSLTARRMRLWWQYEPWTILGQNACLHGLRASSHVFTKQEIAEAEGLSRAYIQQLMTTLKAAGLVAVTEEGRGFPGPGPETISVAEV